MRNSPDFLLQNLLARAASLLFRVGETLGEGPCPPTQTLLKIEISTFFLEGKSSLSEALLEKETPMQKESGQSVPSAENSGPESNWDYPNLARENTSLPDGPVSNTEAPISPEAQSGSSLDGGIGESLHHLTSQEFSSVQNSLNAKSSSGLFKSSGKFLKLTNDNGRRMLVAKDDLSNVVSKETDSPGCWIYYKSQVDPDHVQESFEQIWELLND